MPSPRNGFRGRRGWSRGHFMQLASGNDFCNEGWGELWSLSATDLERTVAEMAQCYLDHRAEVQACLPEVNRVDTPWFEKYAIDPQRLLAAHQKASAA
jgi:hypothetical protein